MQFDEGLKQFLRKPLMIIIGTADARRRPAIARAVGLFQPQQEGHVEVTLSGWQWPDTVSNIRETGLMAVTFVSPSDYVSYQMKGQAWLRPANADDTTRSVEFIDAISTELVALGVPAKVTEPWLINREPVVAVLKVGEIYVQTPGPNAGMTARRPS